MIYNNKFNKVTLDLSVILDKIKHVEPFEPYSLPEYLYSERFKMEHGGARKRKTIFKTSKKTKRTKRTKK